ncbi:MAG: universal stress protein [Gammaproteobacteria bacterium]|uniref:universal stress protein n=1 Tax=Pseudomaricurvus alcaniphilus TaxID=1166482 RepID=UPI001408605A|nr:universal stress protein [Pseudomaricurvus alcaniphilus]MBR9912170.1 universal stress protein [Gammaproteobacteria bacterium]NHN38765.1 universal stress protein [Pseudomaricurvus alcaniphilus]
MVSATLLVVIDPTTSEQKALKRAEQIAVDSCGRLHLFCCDYLEDIGEFSSRKAAKHTLLQENREALEALAAPLRAEGLEVTTEAYWNQDWQESVVRACVRVGADLVIKSSMYHSRLQRQLKKSSDYTLLRKSPCATLLVKDSAPWMEQTLVAALALDANDGEHETLNSAIMKEAQRLAQATQSQLHIIAALEHRSDAADALQLLQDDDDELSNEAAVGARFGVDPERVHIKKGNPRDVIIEMASELRADALIIGTVARRGLRAALLGNTAEKVLDQLDMDILVVN